MFASVAASGSRAGTLLVAAEAVAVPALVWFQGGWFRGKSGSRPLATIVPLLILTGALTAVAGGGIVWDRLWENEPLALRRHYLEASLQMARERPWTGFGLGTWPHVYPAYARVDNGMFANRAHNDWAEWAAEGGIPFAAAMLLLAAGSVPPAVRSVWGIGLISVAAHALVDYPFARLPQAAWWFAVLALVCALPRQNHAGGPDQDVQVQPE
jgi:O-antigen ligase